MNKPKWHVKKTRYLHFSIRKLHGGLHFVVGEENYHSKTSTTRKDRRVLRWIEAEAKCCEDGINYIQPKKKVKDLR